MNTMLTLEVLQEAIDKLNPVLYYATADWLEQGKVYYCKEAEFNPECVICHPDDLETLRKALTWRRLLHIKLEPMEASLARIRLRINPLLPVSYLSDADS